MQQRASHKVMHHRVVFPLTQPHQICRCLSTGSRDGTAQSAQLSPIAGSVPSTLAIGQKFMVIKPRIMQRVEEVFHVIFHHAKTPLSLRGRTYSNERNDDK